MDSVSYKRNESREQLSPGTQVSPLEEGGGFEVSSWSVYQPVLSCPRGHPILLVTSNMYYKEGLVKNLWNWRG